MANTKFTKERLDEIEKKIKENGYNSYACPNCGAEDDGDDDPIDWNYLDYTDCGIEQSATCCKCGFEWTEFYEVVSISFKDRHVVVNKVDKEAKNG